MAMTLQRVDHRHQLSLPMFYPDYKPGSIRSTSSKDVQFYEDSSRQRQSRSQSTRSQSTQRDSHKATKQLRESSPRRVNETSLKSCLRKSSGKHAGDKENLKDSDINTKGGYFEDSDNDGNVGYFKDNDNDLAFTATENRRKFPKRKWRATKVEHKDSADDSKEKSGNVKMKGFAYPRFRYPLRFHYGSADQSKSRIISAVPAGFRTSSFYSTLPRRQRQIAPDGLFNITNRKGKDDKRKEERKKKTEDKTEVDNDRNSRPSSPERELNGVYHVVHEAETTQAQETKAEERHKSKATYEDKSWNVNNKPDDYDNEAIEVKDIDADDSNSSSSRSIHSNRSKESIKDAGSSSDEERSKNESGSSDDADLRRSRKKEKSKNKKKKKKSDKMETKYADDFDEDKSDALSVD